MVIANKTRRIALNPFKDRVARETILSEGGPSPFITDSFKYSDFAKQREIILNECLESLNDIYKFNDKRNRADRLMEISNSNYGDDIPTFMRRENNEARQLYNGTKVGLRQARNRFSRAKEFLENAPWFGLRGFTLVKLEELPS